MGSGTAVSRVLLVAIQVGVACRTAASTVGTNQLRWAVCNQINLLATCSLTSNPNRKRTGIKVNRARSLSTSDVVGDGHGDVGTINERDIVPIRAAVGVVQGPFSDGCGGGTPVPV